jgi:hypothetical protein
MSPFHQVHGFNSAVDLDAVGKRGSVAARLGVGVVHCYGGCRELPGMGINEELLKG